MKYLSYENEELEVEYNNKLYICDVVITGHYDFDKDTNYGEVEVDECRLFNTHEQTDSERIIVININKRYGILRHIEDELAENLLLETLEN